MNASTLRDISLGTAASPQPRSSAWATVVGAGAAAATLDLTYVFTLYYFLRGVGPQRVLRTISS